MVQLVQPMDAVYLWSESATSPAHVVALQIFDPPADAAPDLLERLYARMTDPDQLKSAFRRRPYRSLRTGGQFAWNYDTDVDLTLQVRRVALPQPGRIRELLDYVAAFHSVRLDRDRPLWAAHLVEGLSDGRFALCTKMHHAMFDGVTMGRHLLGGLSDDPDSSGGTAPWIRPVNVTAGKPRQPSSVLDQARSALGGVGQLAGSARALAQAGITGVWDRRATYPFSAPNTMFNGPVGSARRFAGQDWPTQRLRDVARRAEVSTNDVALAMCAGALREYLIEQDSLPSEPLVAMVPISFRPKTPAENSSAAREGNSWGTILCELATDSDDAAQRLTRIRASMLRGKDLMSNLDPVSAALVSASNLSGVAIQAVPALPRGPRAPFNLVISNVPAVAHRLYLDGCALTDNYPVSVVTSGQALNITLISYVDRLAFGITGCRRSVPHLQRLLTYLENSLQALEKAV